jgi:hypothetical protein
VLNRGSKPYRAGRRRGRARRLGGSGPDSGSAQGSGGLFF